MTYHFYYSAQCKRDRRADHKPELFAKIGANVVEYTHCQRKKTDGPVYAPDEKYLGQGVMAKRPKNVYYGVSIEAGQPIPTGGLMGVEIQF